MPHGELEHKDFRIILTGESGVGKTCLVSRCKYNYTIPDEDCVQGQRGWAEETLVYVTVDNYRAKLILADTAGQEKYGSLPPQFYRRCDGVLLVYDINSRSSFESLPTWVHEIRNNSCPTVTFLIGNKLELARATTREEAERFARANKFDFYMEVSAKTGANREDFLRKMGEELLEKSMEKVRVKKRFENMMKKERINKADGDTIKLKSEHKTNFSKRKRNCMFKV